MTALADTPMFDSATEAVAWKKALRRAGFAYFYSRVCVMIGAALVAAELRADANIVEEKYPFAQFADPDYPTSHIPKNAARPMLDVLTSWDGVWYLRLVRLGYPHKVLPNVNYNRYDARAAFFPTYPMLIKAVDKVLPGGADVASVFINLLLGVVVVYIAGLLARQLFGVTSANGRWC